MLFFLLCEVRQAKAYLPATKALHFKNSALASKVVPALSWTLACGVLVCMPTKFSSGYAVSIDLDVVKVEMSMCFCSRGKNGNK